MPLFELDRHEALSGAQWDENEARAAIARIVTDAHQRFDEEKTVAYPSAGPAAVNLH